jgi:hypothetical protein
MKVKKLINFNGKEVMTVGTVIRTISDEDEDVVSYIVEFASPYGTPMRGEWGKSSCESVPKIEQPATTPKSNMDSNHAGMSIWATKEGGWFWTITQTFSNNMNGSMRFGPYATEMYAYQDAISHMMKLMEEIQTNYTRESHENS